MAEPQKRGLPLLVTRETCSGRTYIVTGANTGLGFEAAKHLAVVGAAKVVLAVRNLAAGEAAKAKIDAATGDKTGVIEVWHLDLSSYDSVKAFAARATEQLERIDGLIENAGVSIDKRAVAEGHVLTNTVNVFSTFLLAALLLPEMSKKAKKAGGEANGVLPRLAIVSSTFGFDPNFKGVWEQIKHDPTGEMDKEEFNTFVTYPLSKLLVTLAARHLAHELAPVDKTGVIVNMLCPGMCVTDLGRNLDQTSEAFARIEQLQKLLGRTAEDGSRTLLHAVVAGKETHGLFLDSCEIGENIVPDWVKDDLDLQKRVWETIAKEIEVAAPGSVGNMVQCA